MARAPAEGMSGFPENGDEHAGAPPLEPRPREPEPVEPEPDPLADIKKGMDDLRRENAELRRLIPPAQPKVAVPGEPEPEPDWDKMLFADPKGALKLHGERVAKQVSQDLRAEYQRDRGTAEFWNRFYGTHPDLKQDSDLVEIVLNSNLPSLANIPVEDAYSKLAELTRDRILRYAGGAAKKRPKAQAEGAGGIRTPAPAPEPESTNITSLSDVLRGNRARRRKAGAA